MNALPAELNVRRTASKSNVNCCVFGCNSVTKRHPELSFHKFPPSGQKSVEVNAFGEKTLIERRKLWEIKLKMGKPLTPWMHVCSRHFTNDDYTTPNEGCYARRHLKKTAVPSQNLPLQKTYCGKSSKFVRQEERNARFDKRRQTANIESGQQERQGSEELQTLDYLGMSDAAEGLLLLQDSPLQQLCVENVIPASTLVTSKTVADCSTQTDESYIYQKSTNSEIGIQVNTSCFSVADFILEEKALNVLTGISTFAILSFLVTLFSKFKPDKRPHRLSIRDRILLVFFKLKLDLTYAALGVLFGDISVPSVKRIFVDTVRTLSDLMKIFIYLPSKESILMSMPKCFERYQKVRIVLDCTEIFVQIPKKLCCRIKLYSNYKKHHTLKFMTGVTPSGFICYVSSCYGGRASDKSIFEQSKLYEKLEPYVDQIMVDKGFLIEQICEDHGIRIIRPPFLRKKKQFNKNEALATKSIAAARVHIERINARIKVFRIFKKIYPLHLLGTVNDIFTIICAIVNLSRPIMRKDLFLNE